MQPTQIITVSLYAMAALTLLGGFFIGRRKRFLRSLIRCAATVSAAVFAFVTVLSFYEVLSAPLPLGQLQSYIELYPEAREGLEMLVMLTEVFPKSFSLLMLLPTSLLGPLLFCLLFWVYRLTVGLVAIIVCLVLRIVLRKRKLAPFSKLLGGMFGVVRGAVFLFVFIFPLMGYLSMAGQVFSAVDPAELPAEYTEIKAEVDPFLDAFQNHPVSKTVYGAGGEAVFEALTSFSHQNTEGESFKVVWSEEIDQYITILFHAKPLSDFDLENVDQDQIDAIKALAGDIGSSDVLSTIIAEVLSAACTAWDNGEAFLDTPCPTVEEENAAAILNAAIDTFKDSTPDTVAEDLLSVAELFEVMAEHDVFNALNNPDQLLDLLGDDAFMSSAIEVLKDNERLEGLLKETIKTGVKAAMESAADDEAFSEAVDSLTASAADELNALASLETKEEQVAAVSDAITQALANSNIDQGGAVVDYVAELLIDEFADKIQSGTVTPEDIAAYLGLTKAEQ